MLNSVVNVFLNSFHHGDTEIFTEAQRRDLFRQTPPRAGIGELFDVAQRQDFLRMAAVACATDSARPLERYQLVTKSSV